MTITTEELERLVAEATPGPWLYRPEKYDDWGYVRATAPQDGWTPFICQAKDQRVSEDGENEHRRNGTDPWEANAKLIAAAPDIARELLAARKVVEAGRIAHRTCVSAWAAGEPSHKVRLMLDAADAHERSLTAYDQARNPSEGE